MKSLFIKRIGLGKVVFLLCIGLLFTPGLRASNLYSSFGTERNDNSDFDESGAFEIGIPSSCFFADNNGSQELSEQVYKLVVPILRSYDPNDDGEPELGVPEGDGFYILFGLCGLYCFYRSLRKRNYSWNPDLKKS